ncbi:lycopene cyclase domain-containing protein [Glaciibacter sp. 2TAF33]|uniref:lycopene cyclase domain-containing protein n=1 Tax=Glaciibacter sp. 2TAF33 TaxID=3233015 RepID=UPI003F8F1649
MTYLALNTVFLAVALATAGLAWLRGRIDRRMLSAAGIALVAVLLLTAVFDNVMIAVGLFSYDPDRILGVKIGLAPLEDFGYPLAAVIGLPALWALLAPRQPQRSVAPAASSAADAPAPPDADGRAS